MVSKNKKAYTLLELIVVITLFAVILLLAFESMSNIAVFRTGLSNRLDIEQDLYFAMETISSTIKNFEGDIDYEEYFDRTMMGTTTASGHYSTYTGFGNYGSGGTPGSISAGNSLYFCRSTDTNSVGTDGCADSGSLNDQLAVMTNEPQRYLEYAMQFVDYNSNKNADCSSSTTMYGDENCDGTVTGDDDDYNLGTGPVAFSGNEVTELYLIKKGKTNERMLYRLNITKDNNAPTGSGIDCDIANGTGSGCLGNIQILKLVGKDYGVDHSGTTIDSGQSDGIIDTWQCDSDFCTGLAGINVPTNNDEGWVDLLPSYINVKSIKFFVYPNKDYNLAWAEDDTNMSNPYVRISITLGLSRERRRLLKFIDPEINLTTTINLTKK